MRYLSKAVGKGEDWKAGEDWKTAGGHQDTVAGGQHE